MAGTQKEIYNVDSYTDAELYNVLDLNNPTDRELEAKILNMIWKYDNMQNDSGVKLSNFFKQIYDRFFNSEEEEEAVEEDEKEENTSEKNAATHEGMENMNVMTPNAPNIENTKAQSNANANANANSSMNALSNNFSSGEQANPNNRTFSYNIPIDYSKDNLNPLLKQTTKRIIVIDSQYRENKSSPSTNFTFNLSNPLKDVVSLKLYSFQIPYTWYTINNNYGSNFFYLKGNTNGIINNGNDVKISIEAGNYTAQTLITAVNNSLSTLQNDSNFLDICFGTTNASYDNTNSLSKITFDIKKIYNEGDYEIYFPYWDSPQIPNPPITNTTGIINTPKSIPGFLGFNFPYYSPNVVYSIYNQLSGYSTAGLAGAYSPTNNVVPIYQYPTIDDTVNSFKLTSSNNYFDIGIIDRDKFVDPSNGTIYGGLRITLSNLAVNTYYTRNELVNELNYQLSTNPFLDNTYSQLNRVFEPLYLYYIDPYTFVQQNLTTPPYIPSPVYPYLYLTQKILNPFYTASNFTMPKDTPMYPLYIQPILQPDFTNPALLVPNPLYNPQLLYGPSTPIPQLFPFNKSTISNPFDPNGGSMPNPYDISQNKYIDNPYIPLFSAKTQSYLYYIDTITIQTQNLTVPPYSSSPTFPYLYIPKYIPNPFDPSSNLTNANAYYPLYTEPYVQIDPTNIATTISNPFYNPQLINQPSIIPSFPFNSSYIPNPFDPNLFMIPNPRDFSGNNYPNLPPDVSSNYMINPYYALATTPTINYKYYIDSYTFLYYYKNNAGSLNTINSYVYLPSYIYMYLPKYIYNPFNAANVTQMQASQTYSYWPLYNIPLVQPDPTNPSLLLPNPFYNPQISNSNAPFSGSDYPYITDYIPNPFDPNIGFIPNPYTNNKIYGNNLPLLDTDGTILPIGYMINPYYASVSSPYIYYKYYIDSYTFSHQYINTYPLSYYNYTVVPTIPYLYVPQYIINPFYAAVIESIDPNYCYLPLYKQSTIQPDPTQPNVILPNPFYNPQISDPNASFSGPTYPFDTEYITNPFDPNAGIIPNPYYFSENPTMINPYYALISSPTINNIIPNPAYNSNAIYDISNTLITNVGFTPNPAYNSKAIYDNSNNNATVFESFTNIYKNYKANYSTSNQTLNQIVTIPNPYYNPNISSEYSNPVNNWLGSSFSHYELRLKLNRLTMPIINSAYSKKTVPNVINQKITVKFPEDSNIWLGKNSAFLFNSQINPYPLSLMISESAIYETKVSFNSTPTIEYKCIKPYYDIPQNNYKAYVIPNIDTNGNNIPYIFSDYMNDINNSISTMNTNSINSSNPGGIFRLGTNPTYLDGTSSNTLFYKNSTSTLNIAADITKTFGNNDYYLDLGTGNLIQSLGLTNIQVVTGFDASNNNAPVGPIIYTDASKNTYENSQYYGGYGIEFNENNYWVAVGQGGGNVIVYSRDQGTTWNQGNTIDGSMSASAIFTQRGNKVKYNGVVWVAAGKSGNTSVASGNIYGNTLAYSSNGMNWSGLGNSIFYDEAKSIGYSSSGDVWVAVGSGINGGNTIACTDPTKDFVNSWQGIMNTPLDVNGTGVANDVNWDFSFNCWVAVGTDGISTGSTIVTSTNGASWFAAPSNPFGPGGVGYSVSCNGQIWVAVGSSPNTNTCIAYALPIYNGYGVMIDGSLNWVPVYTIDLFKYGNPVTVSYNDDRWITGGNGVNILATSPDGITWTKESDSPTNAYNTFLEGINHIRWNSISQKWIMLGNCGFSGNSIAISDTITNSTQLTIPSTQPFPSGKSISTTYNIDLSVGQDNTLIMLGTFPVNANGYNFLAGNFITLITNPTSANKFSGRELIDITPSQAASFSAPNTATLTELVNAEFNNYQDLDGDYVLNNSNISLNVVNNTVYATLKIVIKKYLTQYAYNMILNDSADVSFNTLPSVASWHDPTNTWWKYLKIPHWNYPLGFDASGNYFVNGIKTNQLTVNKSLSTITNVSYDTIRPNQLTIRKTAYTDLDGNHYPVNNKIIIQPQTVLPNPITAGDMTNGTPNANIQRIPGWRAINPISGLTTDNISDSSDYNGYGYNTVIITVPDGDYSADELTAYINNKLNASPYIPTANQLLSPLLTYNQKCITFGSGINLVPIRGVGNICEFLFNINMIYDTRDYLLDFFDPYGFSVCNNVSKNIKSTSWDSTLGWVLGYRNYTEYPLSDTLNATNTITSGSITGTSLLKLIASNIANNVFTITASQLQNTVDPSLQPHIISLQGDTAVSVNIYNYFLITLDDFNQNHLNDGLVTTSQSETDLPLPSYANRTLLKCDPITQNLTVSNINTNSTVSDQNVTNIQRNLTQKQIYAAQEIVNTMQSTKSITTIATQGTVVKKNAKYYSNGPFSQDVFAIVPLKLSGQQNNTIYVDYSGTLQNQERVYFGPVNIHRMTVALVNDRGETVDLNGANWTFSIICEQLYQQKKT